MSFPPTAQLPVLKSKKGNLCDLEKVIITLQ